MKTITYLLMLISLFVGCSKNEDLEQPEKANDSVVIKWLESEKSKLNRSAAKNLDLLEENLDFATSTLRMIDGETSVWIINVNREYNKKRRLIENVKLNLVVIMSTASNKITTGYLVKSDWLNGLGKEIATQKSIASLFTDINSLTNGSYVFLSPTGRWLFQMTFSSGNLISSGQITAKSAISQASNLPSSFSAEGCIDWYLVTTFYLDGVVVSQTSEYVGTTCPSSACTDPNFQSICPDDSGSGGSAGGDSQREVISISEVSIEQDEDTDIGQSLGTAPPIKYSYNATLIKENGSIIDVIIYPITADPMQATYTDLYGRRITRKITLYGHANTWNNLGSSALIKWSCFAYKLFTGPDISRSKIDFVQKSKVSY